MFYMLEGNLITTQGTNVTEFYIGSFGNKQTDTVGADLLQQMCIKKTCCIRQLSVTRAKEVQVHRFLENETVTTNAINKGLLQNTNNSCFGIEHAICIFDTVSNGYPTQPIVKQDFGSTTHEDTQGFHVHGSLLLNAETKQILGVGHLNPWSRDKNKTAEKKDDNRLPEEKESFKWQNCVENTISNITNPKQLTFIGDREADILSLLEYIMAAKKDFIIRARHDRKLVLGDKISEYFDGIEEAFYKTITLNRTRQRFAKRTAMLEVKYSKIEVKNTDKDGESVKLYCVIATEFGEIPQDEKPVSWVLLTSHQITSNKQASQVLDWYTWRWTIEEVHRTTKNKGLKIEDSQIQSPDKLMKLSMLAFASAVRNMALVYSRNGNEQSASIFFTESEVAFMLILCSKLEGKTDKLKNRHAKKTMGWASWIMARLGGWKGYDSESPPGPITMSIGVERFQNMHEGWSLGIN
jgi:hypothetical protein